MQTPSPTKALITALAATLSLTACSRTQLAVNYLSRDLAAHQCLKDANQWVAEDLALEPYNGDASKEFSILKNSNSEYKVLDIYCKPLSPINGVIELVPYVRYTEIPEAEYELHKTKDVMAFVSNRALYTYAQTE